MADQELYEKIEAYLNGDLTGAEHTEFEQQVKSDQNLAAQVALFKDVDSAISDKPILNFQKLVEDQGSSYLQGQESRQASVKKINWRRNLAIAATFIVLASALFLWKNQLNTPLSNQELFAQHFQTYNLNESLRGRENDKGNFDEAIQKYRSASYEEATAIFQKIAASDSTNITVAFWLAQSSLNQSPRNFNLAKIQFQKVINDGNSIYVPASKWHLALIALAQEDLATTKSLLRELESGGGNWSRKAKELSAQLDR